VFYGRGLIRSRWYCHSFVCKSRSKAHLTKHLTRGTRLCESVRNQITRLSILQHSSFSITRLVCDLHAHDRYLQTERQAERKQQKAGD